MSRAGWRLFSCESCSKVVWMPTRDRFSPSNEDCECGETVFPLYNKDTPEIKVDNMGNIIEYPPDEVLRKSKDYED